MFSGKFSSRLLSAAAAVSLLSACTYFQRDYQEEPSHSWKQDKNYYNRGSYEAGLATVAYSQGNYKEAEQQVINALSKNPRNPQALMVGGLLYEQLGRLNRSRQYYEDLIILNGNETSILGTKDNIPAKMSEIAKQRLRMLNVRQSELLIEDKDGNKIFNISQEAGTRQGKSAMEEALFVKFQKEAGQNQAANEADIKAVEVLFSDPEQNMISRFLILKELAEKDLITKEEFLSRRSANIGGLLPLTQQPPAAGLDNSVPSPDLIIERINVLKDATEERAITPREFSAERNLIIEALMPPSPRKRMKPKAPAKDVLQAAKDLRKLEVLYDLNLITSTEKAKEKAAIEKYLGINRTPTPVKTVPKTTTPAVSQASKVEVTVKPTVNPLQETIETKVDIVAETEPAAVPAPVKPIVPDVSSPF